jgi:hypothetical protein
MQLRAVFGRYRSMPAAIKDAAIAAGITVPAFLPWPADKGTALGWPTAQRPFDALAAALVLAHALPLAVRSRAAGLCLAVTSSALDDLQRISLPGQRLLAVLRAAGRVAGSSTHRAGGRR